MHASLQSGAYRVLMVGGDTDRAAGLRAGLDAVASVPIDWRVAGSEDEARALLKSSWLDAVILLELRSMGDAIIPVGLAAGLGETPAISFTRVREMDTGTRVTGTAAAIHCLDPSTPTKELWRTLQDVVERRRVEVRLRSSEELHRSTFAALAEGVVVQDRDARIVTCNASAERILGRAQHEIVGRLSLDPDGRVLREDETDFPTGEQPWLLALLTGTPSRDVVMGVRRPDGRLIWISVNSQPVFGPEHVQPRLVVSSFSDITARREMEQRLRASLAEKEVLLREIHHRVKNNMQVVSSLLALESMKVDSPEVQALFEDSQNRIRTMALIHEKLYRAADLARINFPQYLRGLAEMVVSAHQHEAAPQVRISVVADPVPLNLSEAIPLALITNELLTNACKHAFEGRRSGNVHVTLRDLGSAVLELVVADDGVGGEAVAGERGVELELVKMLARQLRGELVTETQKRGFRCALRFARLPPVPAPEGIKKPQPTGGCG